MFMGTGFFGALVIGSILFHFEREKKAALRLFLIALSVLFLFLVPIFLPPSLGNPLAGIIVIFFCLTGVLLFIPWGVKKFSDADIPQTRIDERDIMFSRRELTKDSPHYQSYYQDKPEKKKIDDAIKENPGILSPKAKFYHKFYFPMAEISFNFVEILAPQITGAPAALKSVNDTQEVSRFIKWWAKKQGVLSIGMTELKDYHKYSVSGRGADYGVPVSLDHSFAIALTVEMDISLMQCAPYAPTVMETAQKYLDSAGFALTIAEFIRKLGYQARAHIDAHYQVVCPLVARDAGLGEIGRMGLLMTPEVGPRVRIAVITTDMPLITDQRLNDYTMIDFCLKCKKCADICPSRAISFEPQKIINGVKRWQINSEECFRYWSVVGTDCGRCVTVCPFSHPHNFFHNIVRFGIKNSSLFRKFAILMDDICYGRKPKPQQITHWKHK